MTDRSPYIDFRIRGLLLLLLLCASPALFAQDEDREEEADTEVVTFDTTVSVTAPVAEATEEDTYDYFQKIGPGDTPVYRGKALPDTAVRLLRNDPDFWYAQLSPERKKEEAPRERRGLSSPLIRTILWIIICGSFIAVLVWFLIASDIRLFRRRSASIDHGGELQEENIFLIPFEEEIAKAVSAGNFRLAVRLHYLQLLKLMSERDLIRYAMDRTNTDYLMQLLGTDYYRDFFRLTRTFDYVWYGQFSLSEDAYRGAVGEFDQFKRRLPA